MRLSFVGSVMAVLLSSIAPDAVAQTTGRISGRVVDESGAVLPGVTITAKADDQRSRSIESDGYGRFAITDLSPGLYTLTAALPGFRKERRRVDVTVRGTGIADITLGVCLLPETITVSTDGGFRFGANSPSDVVAHLRIDKRVDEEFPSDPDCRVRVRYSATFLRTLSRPPNGKSVSGIADVVLDEYPGLQPDKEYVVWLTWRADKNAFDSGADMYESVLPVDQGTVAPPKGNCLDTKPPSDYCHDWYYVDELFKILTAGFR